MSSAQQGGPFPYGPPPPPGLAAPVDPSSKDFQLNTLHRWKSEAAEKLPFVTAALRGSTPPHNRPVRKSSPARMAPSALRSGCKESHPERPGSRVTVDVDPSFPNFAILTYTVPNEHGGRLVHRLAADMEFITGPTIDGMFHRQELSCGETGNNDWLRYKAEFAERGAEAGWLVFAKVLETARKVKNRPFSNMNSIYVNMPFSMKMLDPIAIARNPLRDGTAKNGGASSSQPAGGLPSTHPKAPEQPESSEDVKSTAQAEAASSSAASSSNLPSPALSGSSGSNVIDDGSKQNDSDKKPNASEKQDESPYEMSPALPEDVKELPLVKDQRDPPISPVPSNRTETPTEDIYVKIVQCIYETIWRTSRTYLHASSFEHVSEFRALRLTFLELHKESPLLSSFQATTTNAHDHIVQFCVAKCVENGKQVLITRLNDQHYILQHVADPIYSFTTRDPNAAGFILAHNVPRLSLDHAGTVRQQWNQFFNSAPSGPNNPGPMNHFGVHNPYGQQYPFPPHLSGAHPFGASWPNVPGQPFPSVAPQQQQPLQLPLPQGPLLPPSLASPQQQIPTQQGVSQNPSDPNGFADVLQTLKTSLDEEREENRLVNTAILKLVSKTSDAVTKKSSSPEEGAAEKQDGTKSADNNTTQFTRKPLKLLEDGLFVLNKWEQIEEWKQSWVNWERILQQSFPEQLDDANKARLTALVTKFICPELLKNEIAPFVGGIVVWHTLTWVVAVDKTYEVHVGSIVQRLVKKSTEVVNIAGSDGTIQENVLQIETLQHEVVNLCAAFHKPFDVAATRVKAAELHDSLRREWRNEEPEEQYTRLRDMFYTVYSEKLILEDKLRHEQAFWTNTFWGSMMLARCEQKAKTQVLSLIEAEAINRPNSLFESLHGKNVRKHLLVQNHCEETDQVAVRYSAEKVRVSKSFRQPHRGRSADKTERVWCDTCNRVHPKGPLFGDKRFPKRMTTCYGPNKEWGEPPPSSRSGSRNPRREQKNKDGKFRKTGIKRFFKKTPNKFRRERTRKLLSELDGLLGSDEESAVESEPNQANEEEFASAGEDTPFAPAATNLSRSISGFHTNALFGHVENSQKQQEVARTNMIRSRTSPAKRGRSRSEKRSKTRKRLTRSVYQSCSRSPKKIREYERVDAQLRTLVDEAIAVPDAVTKTLDGILHELSCESRPDLFAEHEHKNKEAVKRSYDLAVAALATEQAVSVAIKTEKRRALVDSGATNHNTNAADRVRVNHGTSVPVLTANDTVEGDLTATLVDLHDAVPAVCFNADGSRAVSPVIRAKRCLYAPSFPEEILSTRRLQGNGHAVDHPPLNAPDPTSKIRWNVADGLKRWSPLKYDNGYYLEVIVTVLQQEQVRKITNAVDAEARELIVHRRFGHSTNIPSGCGACDSVVKRKPHKQGGSEKRISSTQPGETWAYDVGNIPLSIHGNQYCHAFRDVNRKSKLIHVSFSKKKDKNATSAAYVELGDAFPKVRTSMRTLVSDKDRAFDSDHAKSVFRTTFSNARFQSCPPHEPKEHGWQETTFAVLKRHGQILLNDSQLPAYFLAYAIKHACTTLNTLRADPDAEVWPNMHRISFNRLRPFGCKVRYIEDVQKAYKRDKKNVESSRGTTLQQLRSGREGVMLGYENVRSVIVLDIVDYKNGLKTKAVREVALTNVYFDELSNSEGTDVREVLTPRQELPDAEFRRTADRVAQRNKERAPNLARFTETETPEEQPSSQEDHIDLLVEFPEEIEIVPSENEEQNSGDSEPSSPQPPKKRGPGRPKKQAARFAATRRVREQSVGVLPAETSELRSAARREASAKIRSNVPVVDYIVFIRRLITILTTFVMLAATCTDNASAFLDQELGNVTTSDRRSILEASARRFGVYKELESEFPTTTAGPYKKIPYRRRRQRAWSGPDVRVTKYARIRSVVEENVGEDGLPVKTRLEQRDDRFIEPTVYEYIRAAKQEHPTLTMRSIHEDVNWNDSVRREQDVIARAGRWVWRNELPTGTTTLRAQYVLKVKRDGRRKTRIVACGNQQARSNGEVNYSPATSGSVVRALIAVAQLMPLSIIGTLDADEAFMQATLRQKIAITLPNDWRHDLSPIVVNGVKYDPNNSSRGPPVLLLTRSIYGLRAAPREWLNHVNNGLRIRGSVKSGSDATTFALYDESNGKFVDVTKSTKLKTGVYTLRKKVRFSVPEARFYPSEEPVQNNGDTSNLQRVLSVQEGSHSEAFQASFDPEGKTVYEEHDPTVVAGTPLAVITVYVDDILIVSPNSESFKKAVALVSSVAKCKTPDVIAEPSGNGTVSAVDFLGISHVRSNKRDIEASVEECRSKVLKFNTEPYASVPCPARVVAFTGEENALGTANTFKPHEKQPPWRTAVGILQYLSDVLWVNTKYVSWQLGKVSASPRETNRRAFEQAIGYVQQHTTTLVFPFLYALSAIVPDEERDVAREATARWYDYVGCDLSGTKNASVDYTRCGYGAKPRPVQLRVYSDSDWSGEPDGKSTSAFFITLDKDRSSLPRVCLDQQQCKQYLSAIPSQSLNKTENRGSLISWSSRRQNGLPALSSAEAELHALVSACKQALYLQQFLVETRPLHGRDVMPIAVHGDNQAANTLVNRTNVSRTRHMSLRVSWSRALFETGLAFVSHIGTRDNPADVLTKPCTSSDYNSRFEAVNLFIKRVNDPPKRRKETTPAAVARVLDWSSSNLKAVAGLADGQSVETPFVKNDKKKSRPQRREQRLGFVQV